MSWPRFQLVSVVFMTTLKGPEPMTWTGSEQEKIAVPGPVLQEMLRTREGEGVSPSRKAAQQGSEPRSQKPFGTAAVSARSHRG